MRPRTIEYDKTEGFRVVTAPLPVSLFLRFDEKARLVGITKSSAVREALEAWLDEKEQAEDSK